MIRELASQHAPLQWVVSGLIMFVVIFTAITVWTFRKEGKASYEKYSKLPLE